MSVHAATPEAIEAAAALLRSGQLVAFPTETVYGLGADATCADAVARIFAAKDRPRFNPLIVHVASLEAATRLGTFSPLAERLARAFWPGPLTLVVAKREPSLIADLVTAGLKSVALRVPAHPIALALIRAAGLPIAAPSANRSGRVSPTTAAHVVADFGDRAAMILDAGATPVGVESTVVDVTGEGAVLLRPGGVTREALEACLGGQLTIHALGDTARPTAPGQLASHYAPRARVRLSATVVQAGEALLAFGPHIPVHDGPTINLSPSGDLAEAATKLFATLRSLDATGAETIAVSPIPETGLGEAILDRLRRAAAPRPSVPRRN